jgi:hypothetical protein
LCDFDTEKGGKGNETEEKREFKLGKRKKDVIGRI